MTARNPVPNTSLPAALIVVATRATPTALFEEVHGRHYYECATVLKDLARSADATGDRAGSTRARKRAEEILWLQATSRH